MRISLNLCWPIFQGRYSTVARFPSYSIHYMPLLIFPMRIKPEAHGPFATLAAPWAFVHGLIYTIFSPFLVVTSARRYKIGTSVAFSLSAHNGFHNLGTKPTSLEKTP
ncbi:hypothetical protein LX36DRAFT_354962 [Colletotrichum falcatum]|nr:hypothetical protein LX36DRAFT_354962 [Colletotrichum falcatum]